MNDHKFPTTEQYKELDELMTSILDEMWGTDNKELIREGIIAYANKWYETQKGSINKKPYINDKLTSKIKSKISDLKQVNILRDIILETLDEYNQFLLKNGYTDTDIISEKPTALDQFLNNN